MIILPHLIFLGGISFCGIRLSLKLVAIPAVTISAGKIQGVLNNKKVAKAATVMITRVMVL